MSKFFIYIYIAYLLSVLDGLREEPVFIADAVAVGRDAQGGHAVQEAGGQAAQPAIAQPSVRLLLLQLLHVQPQLDPQNIGFGGANVLHLLKVVFALFFMNNVICILALRQTNNF